MTSAIVLDNCIDENLMNESMTVSVIPCCKQSPNPTTVSLNRCELSSHLQQQWGTRRRRRSRYGFGCDSRRVQRNWSGDWAAQSLFYCPSTLSSHQVSAPSGDTSKRKQHTHLVRKYLFLPCSCPPLSTVLTYRAFFSMTHSYVGFSCRYRDVSLI